MVDISRIDNLCIRAIQPLLDSSLNEGFHFLKRLIDDWVSGTNRFDRRGEALFIAACEGLVVGICGLNRDPYTGDASVARLRHLYVMPTQRHRGIGRSLVVHTIEFARQHFRIIRLRTDSPAAASFYERIGFKALLEPDSTHHVELSRL
jgi:GNAT superfamily N-acetyltransferase